MHAGHCLQNERIDTKAQIELVLNPWDANMNAETELTFFVPTPGTRGTEEEVEELRVSTTSQDRWPGLFACLSGFNSKQIANLVCPRANALLSDIRVFVQEI